MELKDTIILMESEDYKDRFRAEYHQTRIRRNKLHDMIVRKQAGVLDFEPTCPMDKLMTQERQMGEYLKTLEIRAVIEGVDL